MKAMNSYDETVSKKKSTELTGKEKYDKLWNKIFYICLLVCFIGIFYLIRDSKKYHDKTAAQNRDYDFPKIMDFKVCILFICLFSFIREVFEKAFEPVALFIMKKEHREAKDPINLENYKVSMKKIPAHLYKLLAYSLFSIGGHLILRNMDYFPTTLLGHGHLSNLYNKGYPQCFFLEKPRFFNFYYFASFSYFSADLVWLLFKSDKQSDFVNMLLHHIATLSLIAFSYYTNHSAVGAVVLHLHMITDVLVHATRLSLRTNWPTFIKDFLGISLVFFFLYVRQFVFGQVIYSIWKYMDIEWTSIEWTLTIFLMILYLMHVNWNMMLLYKFFSLLCGISITDTYTFNKVKEAEKEKEVSKQIKQI